MNYSYRPEFIKKSAAEFRKDFPDFAETKFKVGRKQHILFIGTNLLSRFNISNDVKEKAVKKLIEDIKDISGLRTINFTGMISSKTNDLYDFNVDYRVYKIYSHEDKLLYYVAEIKRAGYHMFQKNEYGAYNDRPTDSDWFITGMEHEPIYELINEAV